MEKQRRETAEWNRRVGQKRDIEVQDRREEQEKGIEK